MEIGFKDIKELIKKHPLSTTFTFFGVIVSNVLAYFFLENSSIDILSMSGVIVLCFIFSFIPYALWTLVTYMTIKMMFRPTINENQIEWNEYVNSKTMYIVVIGLVNGSFGLVIIPICYYLDWGIKAYLLLLIAIPIVRLFFTTIKYLKFKRTP